MALPAQIGVSLRQALGRSLPQHEVDFNAYCVSTGGPEHRDYILQDLAQWQQRRDPADARPTAHIGVASFFNLDALAVGGHDLCLLADINRNQVKLYEDVLAMIAEQPNPQGFQAAFLSRIKPREGDMPVFMGAGNTEIPLALSLEATQRQLPGHVFLSSQQAYDRVRNTVLAGRVVPLQIDFFDKPRVQKLRRWLDAHGVAVKSIYAANVDTLAVEKTVKTDDGVEVREVKPDPFGRVLHQDSSVKQAIEWLMNDEGSALYKCHSVSSFPIVVEHGKRALPEPMQGRG